MWIFELLFSIFGLFSNEKESTNDESEFGGDSDSYSWRTHYSEGDDADHAGRWTQNDINIQHNIDMGMAVKDE